MHPWPVGSPARSPAPRTAAARIAAPRPVLRAAARPGRGPPASAARRRRRHLPHHAAPAADRPGPTHTCRILTDRARDPLTMRLLGAVAVVWLVWRRPAWWTALWPGGRRRAGRPAPAGPQGRGRPPAPGPARPRRPGPLRGLPLGPRDDRRDRPRSAAPAPAPPRRRPGPVAHGATAGAVPSPACGSRGCGRACTGPATWWAAGSWARRSWRRPCWSTGDGGREPARRGRSRTHGPSRAPNATP